jgi:hypothetical protein
MSQVVGLPNNSYKPITNTVWVRATLCKLQKWCTVSIDWDIVAYFNSTVCFDCSKITKGAFKTEVVNYHLIYHIKIIWL